MSHAYEAIRDGNGNGQGPIRFKPKVDDSHVKLIAEKSLSKDVDAIELVVYGYAKELGRKPTLDELEASLSFSGNPIHPTSRLLNQIAQLRVRGILNPKELSLTKKATDTLKRKFFIPQEWER